MALQKEEIKTYFGQCKCCLGYAYLKNMWEEHLVDGEQEIYGKMLVDCFSIDWTIRDKVDSDRICEKCILKLRAASNFKTQVLKSQDYLLQEGKAMDDTNIVTTNENIDNNSEASDEDRKADLNMASDKEKKTRNAASDIQQKAYMNKISHEEKNAMNAAGSDEELRAKSADSDEEKPYENIEFLEEEILDDIDYSYDSQESQPEVKKRKYSGYRRYSDDDLNSAIEAVMKRGMSFSQASEIFNIPKRTIVKKVRTFEDISEDIDRKKMVEFINGLKAILTHTNATPFRRKVNSYFCFFCPHKAPPIETPEELRKHTRSVHWDRLTQIDFAMRPFHRNVTVRIDMKDFTCKNCDIKAGWEEMLDHLESEHGVNLEETKSRLVPFRLEENEMTCVLCDYKALFPSMDSHMNSHFKNYICGDCGESFLTAPRLHRHSKTHKLGVFPCGVCDKIFTRLLYRKKHIDIVHKKKSVFKCVHCVERFSTASLRSNHVRIHHYDKLQSMVKTCNECDKTFLPAAYNQHMKLHDESHVCDECGKSFFTLKLLDMHRSRHTGIKNFECDVCFRPYFSQQAVNMHKKYKHS